MKATLLAAALVVAALSIWHLTAECSEKVLATWGEGELQSYGPWLWYERCD